MSLVTDPSDPRLGRGVDIEPVKQNDAYLVLSEEERAKGFIRPVRTKYVHMYMEDGTSVPDPLITMKGVKGCGALTSMALGLAETYAREPTFYGATYCAGCKMHLPVSEFIWDGTDEEVGS